MIGGSLATTQPFAARRSRIAVTVEAKDDRRQNGSRPMSRPRRVGLPWYEPEDYEALRACLADGAKLPQAYETWRIATTQMEQEVRRSGVDVVRVPIEPAEFAAWCERNGRQADAAARSQYAAEAIAGDTA